MKTCYHACRIIVFDTQFFSGSLINSVCSSALTTIRFNVWECIRTEKHNILRTEDPVPLVMVMGLCFPRGARRSFMRVKTEKCSY